MNNARKKQPIKGRWLLNQSVTFWEAIIVSISFFITLMVLIVIQSWAISTRNLIYTVIIHLDPIGYALSSGTGTTNHAIVFYRNFKPIFAIGLIGVPIFIYYILKKMKQKSK